MTLSGNGKSRSSSHWMSLRPCLQDNTGLKPMPAQMTFGEQTAHIAVSLQYRFAEIRATSPTCSGSRRCRKVSCEVYLRLKGFTPPQYTF
jgi:hypothetical protein